MFPKVGELQDGGKTRKDEKGESSSYIDSVPDCAAGLVRGFESCWPQSRSGKGGEDAWFGFSNPGGLSRALANGPRRSRLLLKKESRIPKRNGFIFKIVPERNKKLTHRKLN